QTQRTLGEQADQPKKLRNASVALHQLVNLDQLKGMTRQVVELKHSVEQPAPLSNVEVTLQLFGSKAHADNLHMLWVYACGALRLEHLKVPVAPPEDFDK